MSTRVTVRFGDQRAVHVVAGRRTVIDAGFEESEHPRGKGGQFSAGQSVHVVASHHPLTGNITVHGVHADRKEALKQQLGILQKQHAKLDRNYDEIPAYENAGHTQKLLAVHNEPSAHTKEVKVDGHGSSRDLYLAMEGNHEGGFKVHNAHLDQDYAEAHAHEASKAAWSEKGQERDGVTEREWFNAAKDFNEGKDKEDKVTIEQMENNSHPEFEKFLEERHPTDEILPHPGIAKANRYFVENHLAYGMGLNSGRTGVVRVVKHSPKG